MSERNILRGWWRLNLGLKILVALIAGPMVGVALGAHAVWLKPVGDLFINAIHMMVTPVVFVAIVSAIVSVVDAGSMKRATLRAMLVYAVSMLCAGALGIFSAHLWGPGKGGMSIVLPASHISAAPSFSSLISNVVPHSPLGAFVEENVMQIVVFSIIFGVAIRMAGEAAQPVRAFFKSLSSVIFALARIVISFAPYGVFALLAVTVGTFGLKAVLPLASFVGAVYFGCLMLILFYYPLVLLIAARLNPFHFYKGVAEAVVFAFTTSSSAATLPISMRCAEERLGVPTSIARFLLPLGTTFNLNGLSIYLSVATVFAANLYGITLSAGDYLTVLLMIVAIATGAAAIPGSALIVMGAVMSSVNVPLGALGLIAGVDRLNDMAQTATNVMGDIFSSVVVAEKEGVLKREAWEGLAPAPEDA